jgi:hypothetical protein
MEMVVIDRVVVSHDLKIGMGVPRELEAIKKLWID